MLVWQRFMKSLYISLIFVAAFSVRGQTVANTYNVLHPLTKNSPDGTARYAPTSLNQMPSERASLQSTPYRPSSGAAAQPVKPAEIVARIDTSLAASKISLIGTVSGLKGKLYVTNIGSTVITPQAMFMVCNEKGYQIGSASKTAAALAPNESEKIEIIATNLSAADLKLVKLGPAPAR